MAKACPSFEVKFTTRSEAEALELKRNGRPEVKRMPEFIRALERGPMPDPNAIPLVGQPGVYRYRLGRLRVVYEVDLSLCQISILKVALRDEQTYRR